MSNGIVFVFGSNLRGNHGKGSALDAKDYWGAVEGIGVGRQGDSYAIPTKDQGLRPRWLKHIAYDVTSFIRYAKTHPELDFQVIRIGCGETGYDDEVIAPMFATAPANVHLPIGWRERAT